MLSQDPSMSFTDLSQHLSRGWKNLDKSSRESYESKAECNRQRYNAYTNLYNFGKFYISYIFFYKVKKSTDKEFTKQQYLHQSIPFQLQSLSPCSCKRSRYTISVSTDRETYNQCGIFFEIAGIGNRSSSHYATS